MHYAAPPGTELCEIIGSGTVFRVALVREGGQLRVCKRLAPRVRDEPAGRAAIVREAKLLSMARHPALPELLRVGTDGSGPFLIESYVEGLSLRGLVEGWDRRGRRVPARLVAHVAATAAAALADLHELEDVRGALDVVHGDITPDHVMFGPLGELRFVDFGAARFRGMEASLDTDDRGTLPFVAPEVARGELRPDQAGDVYALAATLLFLATGEPLTRGRDEAAMLLEIGERGVRGELCEQAAGLDARGRAALLSALAPERARRLLSARALADALR